MCQADLKNEASQSIQAQPNVPPSPSEEAAYGLERAINQLSEAIDMMQLRADKLLSPSEKDNNMPDCGGGVSTASQVTNRFRGFEVRVAWMIERVKDIANRLE